MIETKLADQPEQFQDEHGAWHVGRRVMVWDGNDSMFDDSLSWNYVEHEIRDRDAWRTFHAFRLDHGPLVFVDPSRLSPYPSSKIEEPSK